MKISKTSSDDIDSETLISLVESRPVLWDYTLYVFKDRYATRHAWHQIYKTLNPNFDQLDDSAKDAFGKDVIRKWAYLRNYYIRWHHRRRDYENFGGPKPKPYVFDRQLQFLNKLCREEKPDQNEEDETSPNSDSSMEEARLSTLVTREASPNKRKEELSNKILEESLKRHRENEEVRMKILFALEPKRPDSKMSFLQSLMPYLDGFDDDEMLQFQMDVLQVIANIKRERLPNCKAPSTSES